ncbi:hypothetical protein DXG01_006052 [Tephrocybe rancida]|nr:hypothetical protein DXG01_006052 [Tephrocybe rancida]
MLRILKPRGSRICGDFLGAARSEVQIVFRFQREKASHIKKNADIATALYNNKSFHFKNTSTQEGFYENPIILSVLTAILFKDRNSLGVINEEIFNPISLHTLALVLMLVEFCIFEWTTGKFEQGVFSEKQYKASYEVYFADLKSWHFINPGVTTNRRKKLYQHAFLASSAEGVATPMPTLVGETRERAHKELEGRTGETDSELDEEKDDGDVGGAAEGGGHEGIVRLLLEKEADVNAHGGYYGNALQAASSEGHEGIVRLLLEKEADVNAQGGLYGNPLQAASSQGHMVIVKLLLEIGADASSVAMQDVSDSMIWKLLHDNNQ